MQASDEPFILFTFSFSLTNPVPYSRPLMSILINILTIFEVIVCVLLSLLVLMQRPRQEGLGAAFGSGMTDQMFGAQTTNVLQRGSVYLGVALFVLTFLLAILAARMDNREGKRLIDTNDKKVAPALPKEIKKEDKPASAPATTPAPVTPTTSPVEKPAVTLPVVPPVPTTVPKPAEIPATPDVTQPVPETAPTPPPAPELPK